MVYEFCDLAHEHIEQWGLRDDDAIAAVQAAHDGATQYVRADEQYGQVYLCRVKLEAANVYAEYALQDQACTVLDVYSHRLCMVADERPVEGRATGGDPTPWECAACGVPVVAVPDVALCYMGTDLGDIDGMRCPTCGHEMLPFNVVDARLYMSEMMLEAK